jgi:hypothetical protein
MPKKDSDYSNTIIYKISCKDKTVTDVYVGHTINFVQRKISHEQNSKSNTCKLYQIIRNNGGWSNWIMEIIAFFNCANCTEARMKEQEYFLSLHANLNSIEPFPKKEEKEDEVKKEVVIKEEEVVKKEEEVVKDVNVVKEEVKEKEEEVKKKHVVSEPTSDIIQTITSKFTCNLCDYKTCRRSQYVRHLKTTKHIKLQKSTNGTNKYVCKMCDREYKDRSGLWKHNKNCNETTQLIKIQNTIKQNMNTPELFNQDEYKIIDILKENMEYKNMFSILIKGILSKKI